MLSALAVGIRLPRSRRHPAAESAGCGCRLAPARTSASWSSVVPRAGGGAHLDRADPGAAVFQHGAVHRRELRRPECAASRSPRCCDCRAPWRGVHRARESSGGGCYRPHQSRSSRTSPSRFLGRAVYPSIDPATGGGADRAETRAAIHREPHRGHARGVGDRQRRDARPARRRRS